MKHLLRIILLTPFLYACNPNLFNTKPSSFTYAQKRLINSKESTLRLFVLNNKEDSILLRTASTPFVFTKNISEIEEFSKKLEATMVSEMGVGIAAPQVGILKRIICVQRFDKNAFPNEIYINPKIISYSEEKQECREGCLSIPDVREDVFRKPKITVSYLDENFEAHTESFDGLIARVIQHEYDHIEGVLFTDKLSSFKKRLIKSRLTNISKGKVDVDYRMRFPNQKKKR